MNDSICPSGAAARAAALMLLLALPCSATPIRANDDGALGQETCTLLPSRRAAAEASMGQRGEFGAAVAILTVPGAAGGASAALCAVGSPRAMEAGSHRGSVRLFSIGAHGPAAGPCVAAPRATLQPRALSANAQFGAALDFHGDGLLAVGAPGADSAGGSRAGLVRLVRAGGVAGVGPLPVTHLADLVPPAGSDGAAFGAAVAFSADGQQLAVGAPMTRSPGGPPFAGRVYVYSVAGGEWALSLVVDPPRPAVAATFGKTLDWVGGTLLVGAPGDGAIAPASGRVFGFQGTGAAAGALAWELAAPAGASAVSGMRYGDALAALDEHTFAVGGWGHAVVEVLHVNESGLPVHEALLQGDPTTGFGLRVAGAGAQLFVGAPFALGPQGESSAGRVEVFTRSAAGWSASGSLIGLHPVTGAEFGVSVAAAEGPGGVARVIVGEPGSHAACRGGSSCAAGAALVSWPRP